MKVTVIIIALFVGGIVGALVYLRTTTAPSPAPAKVDRAGESVLHGGAAAPGATLCATHRVPETVDAFCHPELVEKLGFCQGHDVPEAFCTRCSPVLIAAFKAEGDWCAEHGLPESQCASCKGESTPQGAG
jgi:hypothetical protein